MAGTSLEDLVMPIHDWTRASDAAYHSFQLGWASDLCARLNRGVLPPSHFAITETAELRPPVAFCDLSEPDGVEARQPREDDWPDAQQPPRTTFRMADDRTQYACRVVTVRNEFHQPVSAVVFVTRQDKETPYRLEGVTRMAVGAVTRGIHLLIVDLFPPHPRNPQGIHKLIWDRIRDEPFELPPDKPLTLAAYSAGPIFKGYVEPVGIRDVLPDMPVFLTPGRYVPCPLEATYQESWAVFPKALKGPLEEPAG